MQEVPSNDYYYSTARIDFVVPTLLRACSLYHLTNSESHHDGLSPTVAPIFVNHDKIRDSTDVGAIRQPGIMCTTFPTPIHIFSSHSR